MIEKSNFLLEFTDSIKDSFPNNLRGILLYGSSVDAKVGNDFDIIIILKDKSNIEHDLIVLKKIIKSHSKQNIDLQLLYNDEIDNSAPFSLDSHGCFIVKILEKAEILFGENPFKNKILEQQYLKLSILNKIQYYIFRARQAYLGKSINSKDKNKNFHKKKIILAMQDLLLFDNISVLPNNIINIFLSKYPGLINAEEIKLLKSSKAISLAMLFPIYEKIYSLALKKATHDLVFKSVKKAKRLRIDNLVAEYILPDFQTNKVIILCDGLPSIPQQIDLMNVLAQKGYAVFFPRYEGTWESEGVFLEKSPQEDIAKICEAIKKNKVKDCTLNNASIFLIGSSFGGAVTLSLGYLDNVIKIISLSPVFDFTKISGMDSLGKYIKDVFPGAYRFSDEGWQRLSKGKLLNPSDFINKNNFMKHFVISGVKDKEISSEDITHFCNKFNLKLLLFPEMGHISFNKLNEEVLTQVLEVLSS